MARRRDFVAASAMVGSALLAAWNPWPKRTLNFYPPEALEGGIPLSFGDWRLDTSISPVLPAPDLQHKLAALYSQLLSRTYADSERQRVMFVAAYGDDQTDAETMVHLPEACYPAQGFDLDPLPGKTLSLPGGLLPTVRLVARKGARVEPITYWTVVGRQAYVGSFQRRLARARLSLEGLRVDGMLVRVSTIDTDLATAFAAHESFIAELYPATAAPLRPGVFGIA